MAETATVSEIPAEIIVTREGGSVKYVPTAFKRGKRATEGKTYPAIAPGTSFAEKVAYLGEKDADAILSRTLNLFAQNWFVSATTGVNEKGEEVPKAFDEQEFVKYATELSARGMSKAELDEAIAAGWDELNAVVKDTNMAPADKMPLLEAISERIKNLNLDKASRKRTTDTEPEA